MLDYCYFTHATAVPRKVPTFFLLSLCVGFSALIYIYFCLVYIFFIFLVVAVMQFVFRPVRLQAGLICLLYLVSMIINFDCSSWVGHSAVQCTAQQHKLVCKKVVIEFHHTHRPVGLVIKFALLLPKQKKLQTFFSLYLFSILFTLFTFTFLLRRCLLS